MRERERSIPPTPQKPTVVLLLLVVVSFLASLSPFRTSRTVGSGHWFKTILGRKKSKQDRSEKTKGSASERSSTSKGRNHSNSEVSNNSGSSGNAEDCGSTLDERAARRIQTAYRGFRARRALRRLKGLKRLEVLGQGDSIQKQTSTTLSYLQSWSKIQAEIRARRISMVTEGRIKQKKQENQIKLEARLHDIEGDWCGGSETMEEILSRIQQREEAAVKRKRAMAYAFAHQWRANSGQGQPQEGADEAASKAEKKTNSNPSRVSNPVKTAAANGKSSVKIMLPKPIDEKAVPQAANKTKMKQEEHHSPPTNGRDFCLSSTR